MHHLSLLPLLFCHLSPVSPLLSPSLSPPSHLFFLSPFFLPSLSTLPDKVHDLTPDDIHTIRQLLGTLPKPHKDLLESLLRLLSIINTNSYVNLMDANNLAVAFAPSILRRGDSKYKQYPSLFLLPLVLSLFTFLSLLSSRVLLLFTFSSLQR